MNKIYNNLNIENLIKTDWFELFNIHQKHEILKCLKNNVDVLIYAKPEFDWHQMFEIREGLDVSIYAKTDFSDYQMDEIRRGLKDNLDVSVYANSEYSWKKMKNIREEILKEKENKENGKNL